MRILYIDIDTLRPDHLGCYGYHRDTSPNIDAIASDGVVFENCWITDAPCLPSRAALWSGRAGFHTGVVGHGGTAADPIVQGEERGFRDIFGLTSWMPTLRRAGLYTATVSPFGERHSGWFWYAGFREIHNTGKGGMESAEEVTPTAIDWIERRGKEDDWFLHVNVWDPHTPYRAPEEFGHPIEEDPLPEWVTEELVKRQYEEGFGPHSAHEPGGYDEGSADRWPRVPAQIDSLDAAAQWIDGYDTGIRYADYHVGQLVDALKEAGVYDDVVIMISSDHGENQGELNVWGDHQTADAITCRVPLIVRWPGITDGGRVDSALHHHYDWAATLIEMVGGTVPENWDGVPFTDAFKAGEEDGREYVVVSQNAWACQRGVVFMHEGEKYIGMRTYHDGYKELEPVMLFNLTRDPHEQHDLSEEQPDIMNKALAYLSDWYTEMAQTADHDVDPMMTVLREGGPFHTRGHLGHYVERLRATGRDKAADRLIERHPDELDSRFDPR